MEPIPVNQNTPRPLAPSGGLTIAALAGAVGQFAAAALRDWHIWDMDGTTQGSLTTITMALIFYWHEKRNRK